MKTIVFLGTQKSGSSREAIRAAERLGYYTVLYTDRPNFLEKRTLFPEVHLMRSYDLNDIEGIRNDIKRLLLLKVLEICAIVSFVDSYCYNACLLAEEFGVNRFSSTAISIMEDKILSRKALNESPYNPRFMVFLENTVLAENSYTSLERKIKNNFPVILKSPNSAGSKDVFKINNIKEFKRCFRKISQESKLPILAEEFLDGPQYLVEVIVHQKVLHIIAIFEQEINFDKRFIITGYNLIINPPSDFYEGLRAAVESIVICHGMENGACHLELRYVNKQWKLVEINPRISGGGMNNLIEIGLGINLVEETLKIALGQVPDLQPRHKEHAFAQYIIIAEKGILEKVTGKNRASRCPGVKEVYVKPRKGTLLMPPLSMGHRYAYVIATGSDEKDAKENAKYAASKIQFWLSAPPERPIDNEIYQDTKTQDI